jgi:glycosyltransferase involved in cell wall biosynthesis
MEEIKTEIGHENLPLLYKAPMGVDLNRFVRKNEYKPWTSRLPIRAFSCGRLNPSKGHDDLIRAVSILKHHGLQIQLRIAGADDSENETYKPELQNLIAYLGVESQIFLLGAISEERVVQELEQSHVFLLASLAEPLGVAIMEAMAMHLPVIVTEGGGVAELVRNGIDGVIIPPRNPEIIAYTIRDLMNHPRRAVKMGESGFLRVSEHFNSGRSAKLFVEYMLKLNSE